MKGIDAAMIVIADSVIAQMRSPAMLYVKSAQVSISGKYTVLTMQATPALVFVSLA
jgi:hypothetical protein